MCHEPKRRLVIYIKTCILQILKALNSEAALWIDLRRFPSDVRRDAGYRLELIQNDRTVSDVKSMKQIGSGVLEIRLWSEQGTFRVIYVSKLRNVVYVLHCFQKKSQATAQADINVAVSRYKSLLRELGL